MGMSFAEKRRACDVKTCLSTSERATAISNIFQTNELNFFILYCCFSLIQQFLLFFTLLNGLGYHLKFSTKQNIPRSKSTF